MDKFIYNCCDKYIYGEIMFENEVVQKFNSEVQAINGTITELDLQVNNILRYLKLPTENVVNSVEERQFVYQNLLFEFKKFKELPENQLYLSRFIHSCADGLFDAALNYLWNSTIEILRSKVIEYDVNYFYDLVYTDEKARRKYKDESDISKVSDIELLIGIKRMEFISETEYKQLENINYMRNWSSAAHPNFNELSGPVLTSYLDQCIRIVFNLEVSPLNLQVRVLLNDVKKRRLNESELDIKKQFMRDLPKDKANTLIQGFFGIYTSSDSTQDMRENINALAPTLWLLVDNNVRKQIGLKYASIKINSTSDDAEIAESFLEVVNGKSYIPGELRLSEIDSVLEELIRAHKSMGNFYTEPQIARNLSAIITSIGVDIPDSIEYKYVTTIISCFLTNGHGEAWNAESYYIDFINGFSKRQAELALLSFLDTEIKQKLESKLCIEKFKMALGLMRNKFTGGQYLDFIDYLIEWKSGKFMNFLNERNYKSSYEPFVNSLPLYKEYFLTPTL